MQISSNQIKGILWASLLSLVIIIIPQISHALTVQEAFASQFVSKWSSILVDAFLVLYALALGFLTVLKKEIKAAYSDWIESGEIIYVLIDALIYVAPSLLILFVLDVSEEILGIIPIITWFSCGIDLIRQKQIKGSDKIRLFLSSLIGSCFASLLMMISGYISLLIILIITYFWRCIDILKLLKIKRIKQVIIGCFIILGLTILFSSFMYIVVKTMILYQSQDSYGAVLITLFITSASELIYKICYMAKMHQISHWNSSSSSSSSSSSRSSSSSSSSSSYSNYDYGGYTGDSSSSSSSSSSYGGGSSDGGGAGGDW